MLIILFLSRRVIIVVGYSKYIYYYMAVHSNKKSMQYEALQEMLEVAEYCILFDKSKDSRWADHVGCYGYPAAILLLSIADCIGSIIENKGAEYSVVNNLNILNNAKYYNLNLSASELEDVRLLYRNKLTHNAYIGANNFLSIGEAGSPVMEGLSNGMYILNLKPFLEITKSVVRLFVGDDHA